MKTTTAWKPPHHRGRPPRRGQLPICVKLGKRCDPITSNLIFFHTLNILLFVRGHSHVGDFLVPARDVSHSEVTVAREEKNQ